MKKVVWALIDSRKGSAGQIRGVVQQLDAAKFAVIEKNIEYTIVEMWPGMVVHTFDPSTQEVEAGRSMSLSPAWLHREEAAVQRRLPVG